MNLPLIIAVTWIGKEYRFVGLDWSYLVVLALEHRRQRRHVPLLRFKRDPVRILAFLPTSMIYIRNLMLKNQSVSRRN
jgi:hypothetical protein